MSSYQAVLFDMDGLIFDTERLAYAAYRRAAEHFGFQLTPDFFMGQCGKNEQGVVEGIRAAYGADKPVEEWRAYIREQKASLRLERGGQVGKKPGLLELLSYLAEREIPYALASSSDRPTIEACLRAEYLLHAFPNVIDGSQVGRGKPNPEIFVKAAALIGASPEHTLVLEDSRAGIAAANAGGFASGFIFDDLSGLPRVSEGFPILGEQPSCGELAREIASDARHRFDSLADVVGFLEEGRTRRSTS